MVDVTNCWLIDDRDRSDWLQEGTVVIEGMMIEEATDEPEDEFRCWCWCRLYATLSSIQLTSTPSMASSFAPTWFGSFIDSQRPVTACSWRRCFCLCAVWFSPLSPRMALSMCASAPGRRCPSCCWCGRRWYLFRSFGFFCLVLYLTIDWHRQHTEYIMVRQATRNRGLNRP